MAASKRPFRPTTWLQVADTSSPDVVRRTSDALQTLSDEQRAMVVNPSMKVRRDRRGHTLECVLAANRSDNSVEAEFILGVFKDHANTGTRARYGAICNLYDIHKQMPGLRARASWRYSDIIELQLGLLDTEPIRKMLRLQSQVDIPWPSLLTMIINHGCGAQRSQLLESVLPVTPHEQLTKPMEFMWQTPIEHVIDVGDVQSASLLLKHGARLDQHRLDIHSVLLQLDHMQMPNYPMLRLLFEEGAGVHAVVFVCRMESIIARVRSPIMCRDLFSDLLPYLVWSLPRALKYPQMTRGVAFEMWCARLLGTAVRAGRNGRCKLPPPDVFVAVFGHADSRLGRKHNGEDDAEEVW